MKRFLLIVILLVAGKSIPAQHLIQQFIKLSNPERHWVYAHPFVAAKSYRITREVLQTTQTEAKDSLLDGNTNGGQVDAFRHAFWMARLSETIGTRKARKLGTAHEKGNYRDFCRGRTEEGALSDSIASVMDMRNNSVGLELALKHPHTPPAEMQKIVIDAILRGKLFVILLDIKGNSYDCSGNLIDLTVWKGKWGIPKCLVGSNTKHL
ncbi:MAG: DUF6973 domain-containing protein [Bacteroidia bacterium]